MSSPTRSTTLYFLAMGLAVLALTPRSASVAQAEVCNVKVVTDANPDYADIGSMIYSITSNWQDNKDKCWAIWYWNHIARRQTAPMHLHGPELTDPIRQFNDYGYAMCSTVAGVNCGIWGAMGLNVRFWDISLHTVPEVEYDGKYHMYDSSLSALYTLCDGKTIAGVEDIGQDGACEASGGKTEPGHIAKYHCLNATSPNGFLTGCDGQRTVAEEYKCFNPRGLKFRWYYNNWSLGHRYILNLRDNEVYSRHYRCMDADSPNKVKQGDRGWEADPAYFVPNESNKLDPETANPRYRIRGNGLRTWAPLLTAESLAKDADSMTGLKPGAAGVEPAVAGTPGDVVFRVQGANVITSMTINAAMVRKSDQDSASISISTSNGLTWKEVFKADKTGDLSASVKLIEDVNESYDVLVKVTLVGKAAASDAQLKGISFDTVTEVNSKTQPSLRLGKNTVYVSAGEQTESIVYWPDLRGDAYKKYVVEEKNIATEGKHPGYMGVMHQAADGEEGYVVFRMDSPGDLTRVTYGGRFYNRTPKAQTEMYHSFDKGQTWTKTCTITDTTPPWDIIRYEKVENIPAGVRTVLFKYVLNSSKAGVSNCSIFSVRMEGDYKPADTTAKPVEVTFTWKERQEDYSTVTRSHTQLVDKLPGKYEINVGGADHPAVDSLTVNLKGARQATASQPADVKYGYSDGKDNAGATKFQDRWVTYGRNLAVGKPYTASVPSRTQFNAGDPDGKILTDGVVGSTYVGGTAYKYGTLWQKGDKPEVTVDLGKPEKCAVFCIQTGGYPFWDALAGQVKDKVEVMTSLDGEQYASQGVFDMKLRWKDIPANYAWPDQETLQGPNYMLIPAKPVEARYVRYVITPERILSVSEVQVLDSIKYDPFDLKLAMPDGKDRSDITAYPLMHTAMAPYKAGAAKAMTAEEANKAKPPAGADE